MFLLLTGDPDAAALLGDILRQVSKDSDPDDLSQMREILCEYQVFLSPNRNYFALNEALFVWVFFQKS